MIDECKASWWGSLCPRGLSSHRNDWIHTIASNLNKRRGLLCVPRATKKNKKRKRLSKVAAQHNKWKKWLALARYVAQQKQTARVYHAK